MPYSPQRLSASESQLQVETANYSGFAADRTRSGWQRRWSESRSSYVPVLRAVGSTWSESGSTSSRQAQAFKLSYWQPSESWSHLDSEPHSAKCQSRHHPVSARLLFQGVRVVRVSRYNYCTGLLYSLKVQRWRRPGMLFPNRRGCGKHRAESAAATRTLGSSGRTRPCLNYLAWSRFFLFWWSLFNVHKPFLNNLTLI